MDILNSMSSAFSLASQFGNIPVSFITNTGSSLYRTLSCYLSGSTSCPAVATDMLNQLSAQFSSASSFFSTGWSYTINYLWYFIPDGGGFPTVVHTAAQQFGQAMASWAFILPVHDLVTIMFLIFTIKAVQITWYLTKVVVAIARGGYNPVSRF